MSKIRQGALIVTVNKVLSKYNIDHPAMDPLEAIINAGRFAELLSSTRALGIINRSKFDSYQIFKIKTASSQRIAQDSRRSRIY